jgi:predicted O-methyltransferase YrrM
MSIVHPTRMTVASPDTPLYRYLLAHQPPEHEALRGLREATRSMANSFMQIAPDQGHFMAFIIAMAGARRVLEIGTFTGYSALAMALALPDGGKVFTCDVNEEWVSIGRPYWRQAGVAAKIEVRLGSALGTLADFERGEIADSFDVAFIDADKENYGHYYEIALRLVRKGGIVILDNMLRLGRVVDGEDRDEGTVVIRNLNDRIAADERVDRVMLAIGDGVTLVRRR